MCDDSWFTGIIVDSVYDKLPLLLLNNRSPVVLTIAGNTGIHVGSSVFKSSTKKNTNFGHLTCYSNVCDVCICKCVDVLGKEIITEVVLCMIGFMKI